MVCPTAPTLLVAVEGDSQDGIGAQGQDFALSRIVASQLAHHPPFAIHEPTLLHVAEAGDGGSRRVRSKVDSYAAAGGTEVLLVGRGGHQDRGSGQGVWRCGPRGGLSGRRARRGWLRRRRTNRLY